MLVGDVVVLYTFLFASVYWILRCYLRKVVAREFDMGHFPGREGV